MELKNCPFCGGNAIWIDCTEVDPPVHLRAGYVRCTQCGCRTGTYILDEYYGPADTKWEAFEVWNRREGEVKMKKIPTLFERIYENHRVVGIRDKVCPGMEWVIAGEGVATVKIDGSCCAIIKGELYKRYDAKNGKKPPVQAIGLMRSKASFSGNTASRSAKSKDPISGLCGPYQT